MLLAQKNSIYSIVNYNKHAKLHAKIVNKKVNEELLYSFASIFL
jgi:hypothetical protein